MLDYNIFKMVHALAALVATGPFIFSPWLSFQLKNCQEKNKTLILSALKASDIYYNIGGWILMLSGIAMLWLHDWHRVFQLWFVFGVLLFIIDSIAEKRLRDPANDALMILQPGEDGWVENTKKIHHAVILQMVCTSLIFIIMLFHSQLKINILTINPFSYWFSS